MTSYGHGEFGGVGNTNSYQGGGFASYNRAGQDSGSNNFTRLSQSVGNNIQKISQNVNKINQLVASVGTPQDSERLRDQLHEVQHYTNQLAKDTNKYLKDLSKIPNPTSQSEMRQRKLQKERLTNDFSTVLNNLQTAQRKAAEKERASVARARANTNPFDDDSGTGQLVDFAAVSEQPKVQSMKLAMEEEVNLQMIREREEAIRQLESDIVGVNEIFKDLAMIVHEQGEVIDSIEANVESTQVNVVEATEQLSQAREYQSKARRKKCCILIVVLVILAIIGLIIGISVGTKSNN